MTISRSVAITLLILLSSFALSSFAPGGSSAMAGEQNACGCYQTDSGACVCEKKARCGCPGLCEPQGCEAQREKAFQRELDAETKKARESDRPRGADKVEVPAKVVPAVAPRPVRTITPGQEKELAKLLDLYFAAHPGARAQSAGSLRDAVLPGSPVRASRDR